MSLVEPSRKRTKLDQGHQTLPELVHHQITAISQVSSTAAMSSVSSITEECSVLDSDRKGKQALFMFCASIVSFTDRFLAYQPQSQSWIFYDLLYCTLWGKGLKCLEQPITVDVPGQPTWLPHAELPMGIVLDADVSSTTTQHANFKNSPIQNPYKGS
jgi:hypothetical protein